MKQTDRTRLTAALREHVARIAADLRARMLGGGAAQERAQALHRDEQVGEDFAVWTDLLSRRAAVLWVLKSVYVRVLEDRGLLQPGRLMDQEAQQLFERLAPNLGETAFLRWVYRDLASAQGGLPELFAQQPAEVAEPADELSRGLIEFWRHKDPDTGASWSFGQERFEGELMGDLYQELDPVVKGRFALCQTPDFVRGFILDRTLVPALEEYGADRVRLLDPACGSGHFLIDGLKRLVAATAAQHPEWERGRLVRDCLLRVVGIDLNDYACALARARLVMTASELAGGTTLAAAAAYHPQVYWADGLEQVEREKEAKAQQLDLLDASKNVEVTRASLTRPEVRAVLRGVLKDGFQAVVANPPYITEKDPKRKEYHREKVGKGPRYVSAHREYSLGSPFTERCFQLAVKDGYVGLITGNNFMKREFGKPLIEKVLAGKDLTLVVDTSQAYIPFHGTPTVMLFARNRQPVDETVRAVMGKRGESGTPENPAQGQVWTSIAKGWVQVGFENEYVSVCELPREALGQHPWTLGGGGVTDLKRRLESQSSNTLGELALAIGRTTHTGQDGVFFMPPEVSARIGLADHCIALATGEQIRDWSIMAGDVSLFPYDKESGNTKERLTIPELIYYSRFRRLLQDRQDYGETIEQRGLRWYEHSMFFAERYRTPLSIAFAFVATHNHFVMDRGGKVFNRSAPVIKLPADATEEDHLALLGLLNSSTACFWMKQVFQPKGATSANRNHPDPERFAHEFTATGLGMLPIPEFSRFRNELVHLVRCIDQLARQKLELMSDVTWNRGIQSAQSLQATLSARWIEHDLIRQQMIFAQEELDWLVYHLAGLTEVWLKSPQDASTLPRGQRAFERVKGHRSFVRERGELVPPLQAECETGSRNLPPELAVISARREDEIRSNEAVTLIESYMYKRLWRDTEQNIRESEYRKQHDSEQLHEWLFGRVEAAAQAMARPFSLERVASALMNDPEFAIVATVYSGSSSYSLDKLIAAIFDAESVANHPYHVYTESGMKKRLAWEETWRLQRLEDAGQAVGEIPVPPEYSQGSRGKSTDFLKIESWKLRGALDVPKERFIAFTEVPGRDPAATLYGWAGWTPLQRLKAILSIDEDLEDAGVPLGDRTGLLDSAWRLLPDVFRDDPQTAGRLKAELQALVGLDGPSKQILDDWRARFPPPGTRPPRTAGAKLGAKR